MPSLLVLLCIGFTILESMKTEANPMPVSSLKSEENSLPVSLMRIRKGNSSSVSSMKIEATSSDKSQDLLAAPSNLGKGIKDLYISTAVTSHAKYVHTWTIDDFLLMWEKSTPGTTVLKSPSFPPSAAKNGLLRWYIELRPKAENQEFISVHIYMESNSSGRFKFTFSIVDAQGEEKLKRTVFSFQDSRNRSAGFKDFAKSASILYEANGLLVDGKLILRCEIDDIDMVNASEEHYSKM